MASIDKIYMTDEQGRIFWNWILDHDENCSRLTGTDSLKENFYKVTSGFVANYPESIDWYLWNYCTLDFIGKRLREQYVDSAPVNEFGTVLDKILEMFDGVGVETIVDFVGLVQNYGNEIKLALWAMEYKR